MSNTTELLNTIESSLSRLSKKVEGIEVLAYENILKNIKDLDYNSSGALIQSANNTKVLGSMKAGINKLVNSPGYTGAVKTFGKSYDIVGSIQNDYFESIVKDFKPSGAVKVVRNTAVSQMVDNLIGGGVNQEVTQRAGNILLRNIQSGSNVRQVTEELRGFMLTTSKTAGALSKYSGQIATDAINQYSAAYNEQVIEDLGFEWYQYVGSIRDTTRPWCAHLVNQRYIHKSELSAAANGNFRGVKVSVAGLYANSNGTNLPVLRGGYNCKHQFRGVATENVPLHTREKITGNVKAKEDKKVDPVPTDKFTPAKNETEAILRLQNAGVKNVKLKGLKPNEFNTVLRVIEKQTAINPIKLDRIETYRKSKSLNKALYSPSNNSISINLSNIKKGFGDPVVSYEDQIKALDKTINKFKKDYLGNPKYKQTTVSARLSSFRRRQFEIEAKILRGETARPWTLSSAAKTQAEALEKTFIHELGHYQHFKVIGERTHFNYNPINSVSEYGRTNSKEYLAEWYVDYIINGPENVPEDLLKLFKNIGK